MTTKRVLVVGPFGEGFLPGSYARALEAEGQEVIRFDSDRAYLEAAPFARHPVLRRLFRAKLWRQVNQRVREAVTDVRPHLVLVFKCPALDPEVIRWVRREVAPIVNYYTDNPYCGVPLLPYRTSAQRRDLVECLKAYSSVYIWSEQLVSRLTHDGVSATFLPFGVDPLTVAHANASAAEQLDATRHPVVFVGLRNVKRDRHLSAIRRHQVTVWGPGWALATWRTKRRHAIRQERVFGRDFANIYANAGVALNILNDLNMPGHNMRTFEIPAVGGLMLATYTREQAEFFPEGEAAWYYRSAAELDDLLDRLLGDPIGQARIRSQAAAIAKNHDYRYRARQILADVFNGH